MSRMLDIKLPSIGLPGQSPCRFYAYDRIRPKPRYQVTKAQLWGGGAAVIMIMTTFAIQALPIAKPRPKPVAQVQEPVEEPPPIKKSDRLKTDWLVEAPVRQIPLTAPRPVEQAPPDVPDPDPPRKVRHEEREHEDNNICTRHNMRKVYTHGGRSWRCRRR